MYLHIASGQTKWTSESVKGVKSFRWLKLPIVKETPSTEHITPFPDIWGCIFYPNYTKTIKHNNIAGS